MQAQGQTYAAAQVRPPQAPGNVLLHPADANAVSRMLQQMPSADVIARTLHMELKHVQGLMSPNNAEGKTFLAQQLVQRGAPPGVGQAVVMHQQAGGSEGHVWSIVPSRKVKSKALSDHKYTYLTTCMVMSDKAVALFARVLHSFEGLLLRPQSRASPTT